VWIEEPEFRGRTTRYITASASRQLPDWRQTACLDESAQARAQKMLAAAVTGPLLYARSRFGPK